jgi:hypothetical protein
VSWVAHDVEPYVIQKHLGKRISFLAVLFGSWSPDLFTKWLVYGVDQWGIDIHVADPSDFHRSWPGIGPLHAPVYGVVLGIAVWVLFRNSPWALGLMIGQWSHSLSDTLDTKGTMLFFPLTTERVSFDAWAYAAESGRGLDTAAYFSCLGFVWDGFWLAMTAVHWQVLTRDYFRETVFPIDPFWAWAGKWVPEPGLLVLYRAALFYGAGRWVAWLLWAHVLNSNEFDLSWGGPYWIPASQ